MLMAITAQHAHELGCWADEDMRWRVWPRASVVKQEAVSQPTLSCAFWTSTCHVEVMAGDWKLSSMGCLCSEPPSWRWTQHSSAPIMSMAPPEDELLTKMGSPLPLPGERRRPGTPSWWALVPERGLSSLVSKSVGAGETQRFVSLFDKAMARCEIWLLRRRAERAWRLRWGSLLSCTVARAVAHSLLELPGASGADGDTPPLHEVERTFASLL